MGTSYRCDGCGNRTRFDVVATSRTRAFHHFALDGTVRVEEEEVLAHTIESVTCRWCGGSSSIELLEAAAGPVDVTPSEKVATTDASR